MESKTEYYSLYEYIGKRAPDGVGLKVHNLAKKKKIFVKTQKICQGGYDGIVCMYPEWFLDNIDLKTGKLKAVKQIKCL